MMMFHARILEDSAPHPRDVLHDARFKAVVSWHSSTVLFRVSELTLVSVLRVFYLGLSKKLTTNIAMHVAAA